MLLTLVLNVDRVYVLVLGSQLKLVASVDVPPVDDADEDLPYDGVVTEYEVGTGVDEGTGHDDAVASVVVPPVVVARVDEERRVVVREVDVDE